MPWDEGLVNSLVYDSPSPTEGRVIAYPKAVNEALDLALGRDARVFVLGQGVDDPSAMFGTTNRSVLLSVIVSMYRPLAAEGLARRISSSTVA